MHKLINNIKRRLVAAFLLCLILVGQVFAGRPVIIDTDVGVDDVIAILYLLQRPDINVKAITIASTGNAHCEPAMRNMLGLLKLVNQTNIPVDCGSKRPLSGQNVFPANIMEEADTLAGASKLLPKVNQGPKYKAVDLLIDTIQKSRQPITILAIGPLTNIASALQQSPEIKNRIQTLYIMGGAVNVPGNLNIAGNKINNRTAEWNMYIDPVAASIVFNQSIPITLVPLDITNKLTIDMSFYNQLKKKHNTPAANFVFTLLNQNLEMLTDNQWNFWDPLAAVIASDEEMATFDVMPLTVTLHPESQLGRTVIDARSGQNIRVAASINEKQVRDLLVDVLNTKRMK